MTIEKTQPTQTTNPYLTNILIGIFCGLALISLLLVILHVIPITPSAIVITFVVILNLTALSMPLLNLPTRPKLSEYRSTIIFLAFINVFILLATIILNPLLG